jgi:glycine oxidase
VQPLADDEAVERARARAHGGGAVAGPLPWEVGTPPLPDLVHSPTGLVVFDTLTAHGIPEARIAALVAALTQGGVSVIASASTAMPSSMPRALRASWS